MRETWIFVLFSVGIVQGLAILIAGAPCGGFFDAVITSSSSSSSSYDCSAVFLKHSFLFSVKVDSFRGLGF